jgi:hypothetical protein
MEIAMGGFVTTRTANQIIFGYEDEFLTQLKTANP